MMPKIDSIAPAEDMVCPMLLLMAEMEGFFSISPNIDLIDNASISSPARVDVAWTLIWSMSLGFSPDEDIACLIARVCPSPDGAGRTK
jgi:hypothetical protein